MASQTMLSSSSIRGSIPGASQFQLRQSSVYSLTLDEGQDHLDDAGISLSSMNMDDLLKNMWPMEGGGQSTAGLSDANAIAPAASSSPALQLQGSVTLPRTLSRKTVDEVWKDIQKNNSHNKRPQGQGTFGEMTLEDFLVKSGVSREDGTSSNAEVCLEQNVNGSIFNYATASQSGGMDAMVAAQNLQHAEWLQFQYKTAQQHPQQQPPQRLLQQHSPYAKQASQHTALVISSNNPTGGTANNLTFCSSVMDTSSSSPPRGKKRAPESTMEKTVERRHKRMIKNRESAARSRARKQVKRDDGVWNKCEEIKASFVCRVIFAIFSLMVTRPTFLTYKTSSIFAIGIRNKHAPILKRRLIQMNWKMK